MGCYVSQKFIIEAATNHQENVEVYANSNGEVFFGEDSLGGTFFFTLSKEDWQHLKQFIDAQLKEMEE